MADDFALDDIEPPGTTAEDELNRVREEAIRLAAKAAQELADDPSGPRRKQAEIRPTPEKRAIVAPWGIPKGSTELEPMVPEILHDPWNLFNEMVDLFSKGHRASDREVVERSTKLAANLVGGGMVMETAQQAAKKGVVKAVQEVGHGDIKSAYNPYDLSNWPESSIHTLDHGFLKEISDMGMAIKHNEDQTWTVIGKGAKTGNPQKAEKLDFDNEDDLLEHLIKLREEKGQEMKSWHKVHSEPYLPPSEAVKKVMDSEYGIGMYGHGKEWHVWGWEPQPNEKYAKYIAKEFTNKDEATKFYEEIKKSTELANAEKKFSHEAKREVETFGKMLKTEKKILEDDKFGQLASIGIDKETYDGVKALGLDIAVYENGEFSLVGKGAIDGSSAWQSMVFDDTAKLIDHLTNVQHLKDGLITQEELVNKTTGASGGPSPKAVFGSGEFGKNVYGKSADAPASSYQPKALWKDDSAVEVYGTMEEAIAAAGKGGKADPLAQGGYAAYQADYKGYVTKGQGPAPVAPVEKKKIWTYTEMDDRWPSLDKVMHVTVDTGKKNPHSMTLKELLTKMGKQGEEIADVIDMAVGAGISKIEVGDIKMNINFFESHDKPLPPGISYPGYIKSEKLPSETQMRLWPNAKDIDTLGNTDKHPEGGLLAYHGTKVDKIFEKGQFDLAHSNDIGHHFGTKEQAGSIIVGDNLWSDSLPRRIIPVHIAVKNPLTLPDMGGWRPWDFPRELAEVLPGYTEKMENNLSARLNKVSEVSEGDIGRKQFDIIRAEIEKFGYDSIRYLNSVEGEGWSYIVWQKNRVRSASNPEHILYVRTGPGVPNRYQEEDEDGRNTNRRDPDLSAAAPRSP